MSDNPVKATLTITAALLWFFQDLTDYLIGLGLSALDPEAADALGLSLQALALAVTTLIAYRVGAWVQQHFTEPKGVLDEIMGAMHDDPTVQTSTYARVRVAESMGIHDHVDPYGGIAEGGGAE